MKIIAEKGKAKTIKFDSVSSKEEDCFGDSKRYRKG